MADFKLTWRGDELLKQVEEATPEALFEAAQELVRAAASKAPRRTGDLAQSGYAAGAGESTYRGDRLHRKELKPPEGGAVAAFAAFYAGFVELGTRRVSARPFMRPAFDELKGQLGAEVVKTVGGKLK